MLLLILAQLGVAVDIYFVITRSGVKHMSVDIEKSRKSQFSKQSGCRIGVELFGLMTGPQHMSVG